MSWTDFLLALASSLCAEAYCYASIVPSNPLSVIQPFPLLPLDDSACLCTTTFHLFQLFRQFYLNAHCDSRNSTALESSAGKSAYFV
ncbi:hypothetical protein V6N12_029839 [Hibiscus sabdariffa]|uniref:Secreted protein n=1 Tax=Hibiscus sabdariffa TaxID=183260 RepID=A0ABR2CXA7_9ROSI